MVSQLICKSILSEGSLSPFKAIKVDVALRLNLHEFLMLIRERSDDANESQSSDYR